MQITKYVTVAGQVDADGTQKIWKFGPDPIDESMTDGEILDFMKSQLPNLDRVSSEINWVDDELSTEMNIIKRCQLSPKAQTKG